MGPIVVPHPFANVAGGLTPDMLGELRERGGRSDGFIERLLFAYPDPRLRPHWSDAGIPDEALTGWAEIVGRLRERPLATSLEGTTQPHVVEFEQDAKARWVNWYNETVDDANDAGHDSADVATDTKLGHFAARIALILHLLNLACVLHPTEQDALAPANTLAPVSLWAVEGAIRLWSSLPVARQAGPRRDGRGGGSVGRLHGLPRLSWDGFAIIPGPRHSPSDP